MKVFFRYMPVVIIAGWVFLACREPLVAPDDAKKESLLVGTWTLTDSLPNPGTLQLFFDNNYSVRIVNTFSVPPFDATYHYYVETGILYFTQNNDSNIVEFAFPIVSLSQLKLTLEIRQDGNSVYENFARIQ
jgi:hypothetical protein